jgi:hypothetical protein
MYSSCNDQMLIYLHMGKDPVILVLFFENFIPQTNIYDVIHVWENVIYTNSGMACKRDFLIKFKTSISNILFCSVTTLICHDL